MNEKVPVSNPGVRPGEWVGTNFCRPGDKRSQGGCPRFLVEGMRVVASRRGFGMGSFSSSRARSPLRGRL